VKLKGTIGADVGSDDVEKDTKMTNFSVSDVNTYLTSSLRDKS
jgi:hypothetical protein